MWEVHAFATTAWGRLGRFLDQESAAACAQRVKGNWSRVRVIDPDGAVVSEEPADPEEPSGVGDDG